MQATPKGLRYGFFLSLVLHILVLGFFMVRPQASPRPFHTENILTTKLVRLGKARPEHLMPRLSRDSQSLMRPVDKLRATDDRGGKPKATTEAKDTTEEVVQSAGARLKQMSALGGALDRLKAKEEEQDGAANGSRHGEVADLSQAIVGNKFAAEIDRCVRANYNIEGLSPEALKDKSATVLIQVNKDGAFADFRLSESSGVPPFDLAVERAVKRCGKVSAPDKSIWPQIEDGIEFVFVP